MRWILNACGIESQAQDVLVVNNTGQRSNAVIVHKGQELNKRSIRVKTVISQLKTVQNVAKLHQQTS